MGLRHRSQDAPPIYREDTFPAARFSPLHSEGRGNRSLHSAKSRRRLVAGLLQGFLVSSQPFSIDRIGCEDYRIIGKNKEGRFAKFFFAGKGWRKPFLQ